MVSLVVDAQATAQWHALVQDAEAHTGVQLVEELESYLVFLLMRYTERPEMVARVLALDYLEGNQRKGQDRGDRLRDVGDQCLLYSGLFPRRAERHRVRVGYYVDLGRSAYQGVADVAQSALAGMFANLASGFVEMMDTLQAIRCMHNEGAEALDPLAAFELWQDTGSNQARRIMKGVSDATPIPSLRDKTQPH